MRSYKRIGEKLRCVTSGVLNSARKVKTEKAPNPHYEKLCVFRLKFSMKHCGNLMFHEAFHKFLYIGN